MNYRRKHNLFPLIILAIICVVIRLLFVINTDHSFYAGDIFRRLNMSYALFEQNAWVLDVTWNPGFHWILKILFSLTENIQIIRLLLSLFDLGTVIIIFLLMRNWFDTYTAFVSGLIFSTNYLAILHSTHAWSSPSTVFFILFSYWGLERWLVSKSEKFFLIHCLGLFISGFIRNEPWFIAFFIGLVHIYNYKYLGWKKISFYAFLTVIPIAVVLFLNDLYEGSPLWWLQMSDHEVSKGMGSMKPWFFKRSLGILYISFLPLTLFFLPFNIKRLIKKHKVFTLYLIPLVFLFLYILYKFLKLEMFIDPRYFLVLSIWPLMLLPVYIIERAGSFKTQASVIFLLIYLSISYVDFNWYRKLGDWGPGFKFDPKYTNFITFFDKYIQNKKDLNFVIGRGDYNLDETLVYKTSLKTTQVKCYHSAFDFNNENMLKRYFEGCFYKKDIKMVVLFPVTHFKEEEKPIFHSKLGLAILKKQGFVKVYDKDQYIIWEKNRE